MYTGVIRHTGRIDALASRGDGARLQVSTPDLELEPGDSVAIDGVCLTVTERKGEAITAFASGETLARTALADRTGEPVNLETPLSSNETLDGHLTKGTVDSTTPIERVDRADETWTYHVQIPDGHAEHVTAKGAVALDGVSLTIDAVDDDAGTFAVAVVPETRDRTTLSRRTAGDGLHFEADVLARYAVRATEVHS